MPEERNAMTKDEIRNLPDEIRPISMWGYFGYQILFAIPLVGFVLLIVFALGGTRNVNVRNFARSYFCVLIISIILVIIMIVTGTWTLLLDYVYQLLNGFSMGHIA